MDSILASIWDGDRVSLTPPPPPLAAPLPAACAPPRFFDEPQPILWVLGAGGEGGAGVGEGGGSSRGRALSLSLSLLLTAPWLGGGWDEWSDEETRGRAKGRKASAELQPTLLPTLAEIWESEPSQCPYEVLQ